MGQPGADGTAGLPAGGSGPAAAGTGGGGPEPPVDTCAGALPTARVVLSTPRQYARALRDMLGETAVSDDDFAASDDIEVDVVDRPWVTTSPADGVPSSEWRMPRTSPEALAEGKRTSVAGRSTTRPHDRCVS